MKRNVKMFPGFQFSSNGILMDYHPELIYDVRVILESLYPTIVNVPKGRQMVEESFSKKIQTSQRHRRPTIFKLPNDTNPQNNSRSVSIDVNGEKKKNSIFNVISEAVKQNTLNQAKDYEKNVFLAGPKRSVSLDKYLKNYDFDDQEEDDILNSYILPNHALLVDTPQTSFSLDESTNLDGSSRRGTNELLPESSFISQLPSKGLPPPRMSKKYSFGKPVSFYKAKKDFGNIQAMSFDSISSAWESQDDVNNLSRTSLADQKEPLESISIPISNITKPELKTVSLLIPEPEIPKTIPNQPKINHFHTATLTENVTKPDISVKINEIKIDPIIKVDVPIKPVDVPIKTVDERANKSTLELPPMIDLVLANRANSMMTNETQMKLEKSVDLFPSIGQLKTTSSSTIKSVHYNIFTQPNPDKSCVEKLFQAFQTVYQNQQINGLN
ncbi:hypothetical protein BC833DRAFT_457618 [Globomyces pollinis-pini]|nr:hypothetical protein BC833DRAFT_457618 [Globomyces pollinis-pini]